MFLKTALPKAMRLVFGIVISTTASFLISCSNAPSRSDASRSDTPAMRASTVENESRIHVGLAGVNVPMVSVTICLPNTETCQTIDKIKLDTGNVGLRLYKSAVTLNLPNVASENGTVAVCQVFGGGTSLWGPVKLADVQIGNETAKDVSIQIVQDDTLESPEKCPPSTSSLKSDGANGMLGINVGRTDHLGASYFLCADQKCTEATPQPFQRIKNPVAMMPKNNNGVTILFPQVPDEGWPEVTGTLVLGVGTDANNKISGSPHVCKSGEDGFLHSKFAGKDYWSLLNMGTAATSVAASIPTLPHCKRPDGSASAFLCPTSPLFLNIELLQRDKTFCQNLHVNVIPYEAKNYTAGIRAMNGLTTQWGKGTSESIDFGLPFFYGKTVYFVIDGKDSPFGRGPLVAF